MAGAVVNYSTRPFEFPRLDFDSNSALSRVGGGALRPLARQWRGGRPSHVLVAGRLALSRGSEKSIEN